MNPIASLWRLGIAVLAGLLLYMIIVNAVTQPVAPGARSYTAEFTDASGLHAGADVRIRGVRVGKVQSIALSRRSGQSVASVEFTLDRNYGVDSSTRLSIRYQALTGSRYIDVANYSRGDSHPALILHIPTTMTQPSFDITSLFNGLQPVIATLSPDEVNTFTSNVADFLSGDGEGLAPLLKSIHTLTRFVADRQHVVATLMSNLSSVAASMAGHSGDLIKILEWANRPLDSALQVINELRKTELFGAEFFTPVLRLLDHVGFPSEGNSASTILTEPPWNRSDSNVTNIDKAMDRAITNLDDFIESIKLVPVMWENVKPPFDEGAPLPCSHGRFQLPEQMDVLLNGQRMVLCNR